MKNADDRMIPYTSHKFEIVRTKHQSKQHNNYIRFIQKEVLIQNLESMKFLNWLKRIMKICKHSNFYESDMVAAGGILIDEQSFLCTDVELLTKFERYPFEKAEASA
ncbi:hypothetical protein T4D_12922 [Trichinella pseudospiralis]|uniref:Uncharacterized protein n=1 Tax=Trichinella pseudospiralis TaxID=6337 RepID=A0A0V1FDY6_TRIPS|nr:hypothetical protein T4D_12922 [Trichinella pseudospiralis]